MLTSVISQNCKYILQNSGSSQDFLPQHPNLCFPSPWISLVWNSWTLSTYCWALDFCQGSPSIGASHGTLIFCFYYLFIFFCFCFILCLFNFLGPLSSVYPSSCLLPQNSLLHGLVHCISQVNVLHSFGPMDSYICLCMFSPSYVKQKPSVQ